MSKRLKSILSIVVSLVLITQSSAFAYTDYSYENIDTGFLYEESYDDWWSQPNSQSYSQSYNQEMAISNVPPFGDSSISGLSALTALQANALYSESLLNHNFNGTEAQVLNISGRFGTGSFASRTVAQSLTGLKNASIVIRFRTAAQSKGTLFAAGGASKSAQIVANANSTSYNKYSVRVNFDNAIGAKLNTSTPTSNQLDDGRWHTFVYTAENTVGDNSNATAYIDGVRVLNWPSTTLPFSFGHLGSLDKVLVGGASANSQTLPGIETQNAAAYFNGQISYLTIVDSVLDANTISAISPAPRFPEYDGSLDGTASNVKLTALRSNAIVDIPVVDRNFDGTANSYIDVPGAFGTGTYANTTTSALALKTEGSVIVRFKTTAADKGTLFAASDLTKTSQIVAMKGSNGLFSNSSIRAFFTGGSKYSFPTTAMNDGQWHTLVYTVKDLGTTNSLISYYDGVAVGNPYTGSARFFFSTLSSINKFYIGSSTGLPTLETANETANFNGQIAFVTVVDEVISAADAALISQNNEPPTGDTTDPSLYQIDYSGYDETSKAALLTIQSNAILNEGFKDHTFNGTASTLVDVSNMSGTGTYQDRKAINSLTGKKSGSVIVRFKTSATSKGTLFTFKGANGSGQVVALSNAGSYNDKSFRIDFSTTSVTGSKLGGATSLPFNDGKWHTYVYTAQNTTGDNSAVKTYFDGNLILNWSNGTLPFFVSHLGTLDKIYIGSPGNAAVGDTSAQFNGEMGFVTIVDRVLTQEEVTSISPAPVQTEDEAKNDLNKLFTNAQDNTWVFTGGDEVVANPAALNGARNFVGHFEEKIRWEMASTTEARQRYVINTARNNIGVSDINTNFAEMVSSFSPKAVAVMISKKDYNYGNAGLSSFKSSLTELLGKIYAIGAVPVILTPYPANNAADNANIEKYVNEAKSLANSNLFVYDVYTALKTNSGLYANSSATSLSVGGQLEVAKVLFTLLAKSPGNTTTWLQETVKDTVKNVNTQITATVDTTAKTISVSVPSTYGTTSYSYEITFGTQIYSGKASSNSFIIDKLPNSGSFELIVSSEDAGKLVRFKPVTGSMGSSTTSSREHENQNQSGTLQSNITTVMNSANQKTWLFMGDSITHGAAHTKGYDSVPQLFEKFLREKGRSKDVVINTAVSGAKTSDTLLNINERLNKYNPDVVVIMLGTNDFVDNNLTSFKANLNEIVNKVKAKGAIAVLRTPNSTVPRGLSGIAGVIREVASDQGVILSDNFAEWEALRAVNPKLLDQLIQASDGTKLHPNVKGQLVMFRSLLKAMGQYDESSDIATLEYQVSNPITQSPLIAQVIEGEGFYELKAEKLRDAYAVANTGKSVISIEFVLTLADNRAIRKKGALEEVIRLDNIPQDTYTPKVIITDSAGDIKELTVSTESNQITSATVSISGTIESRATVTANITALTPSNAEYRLDWYLDGIRVSTGQSYTLPLSAKNKTLKLKLVGTGSWSGEFTSSEAQVAEGAAPDYSGNIVAERFDLAVSGKIPLTDTEKAAVLALEDATVLMKFKKTSSSIGALFSVGLSTANKYAALYTNGATLGLESAGTSPTLNLTASVLNPTSFNAVALKFDKTTGQVKLFANGVLVATSSTFAPFKNVSGDNVQIGGLLRSGSDWPFIGDVELLQVYNIALEDEELITLTNMPVDDYVDKTFYLFDATSTAALGANMGSKNFRIPFIYTLKNGGVVAGADIRWGSAIDSASNIDTSLRVRPSGYDNSSPATGWGNIFVPETMHLRDWVDGQFTSSTSSFIDPVIVQDTLGVGKSGTTYKGRDGRIFLIADAFPWFGGLWNTKGSYLGDGFATLNGRKMLLVKATNSKFPIEGGNIRNGNGHEDYGGRGAFNMVADIYGPKNSNGNYDVYALNGTPRAYDATGATLVDDSNLSLGAKSTVYELNSNYEVVKNGTLQTVYTKSNNGVTSTQVPMNILYEDSDLQVMNMSYLYLFYSDDNGLTWSNPKNINGMVTRENATAYIVGPGRGIQIQNGPYKGRLVFPVYYIGRNPYNNNVTQQYAEVIYSDDGGETWQNGESVRKTSSPGVYTTGIQDLSEPVPVEMPDGSIKMYMRTQSRPVAVATSIDGGETWIEFEESVATLDGVTNRSQFSAITYSRPVVSAKDGNSYPAIMLGLPRLASRADGIIRTGLIKPNGTYPNGTNKYLVDFEYNFDINYGTYAYSCITELPDGKIGVLRETSGDTRLAYDEFSPDLVLGEKFRVSLDPNGGVGLTAEQRNIVVNKGNRLTIPSVTKVGYVFVGWFVNSIFGTPYDTTKPVTTALNLIAKWVRSGNFSFEIYTPYAYLIQGMIYYDKSAGLTVDSMLSSLFVLPASAQCLIVNSNGTPTIGTDLLTDGMLLKLTVDSTEEHIAFASSYSNPGTTWDQSYTANEFRSSTHYSGDGPLSNMGDGDTATFAGTVGNRAAGEWMDIVLSKVELVSGFAYLPRPNNGNGTIGLQGSTANNGTNGFDSMGTPCTKYEIHISTDGTNYSKVTEGDWTASSQPEWKYAYFNEPVPAKFVRLYRPGFFALAASELRALNAQVAIGNTPAIVYHTITASAGAGGTITPSGSVSVEDNTNKTFTIIANSGYSIENVLIDNISVGPVADYTFHNVTENHTISASFMADVPVDPVYYVINASAGSGGTITPNGSVSVEQYGSKTFSINPNTGYEVESVLVDNVSVGKVTSYTFSNVTSNRTISASFASAGNNDDGSGNNNNSTSNNTSNNTSDNNSGGTQNSGRDNRPVIKPPTQAEFDISKTITALNTVVLSTNINAPAANGFATANVNDVLVNEIIKAAEEEKAKNNGSTMLKIEFILKTPSDSTNVEAVFSKEVINKLAGVGVNVSVVTPIGTITFDSKTLKQISGSSEANVSISAGLLNNKQLPQGIQEALGDRPGYNFEVRSGNVLISDFGGGNVTVSIPYKAQPGENVNAIIIYYINSNGELEIVRNCKYSIDAQRVYFITNHFSKYAVGYNKVNFKDITGKEWYSGVVDFAASREILSGFDNGMFKPEAAVTRAMFITAIAKFDNADLSMFGKPQFDDVGENIWYGAPISWAVKNGIATGIDQNKFAPNNEISREQMAAMLYNYLLYKGISLPESGKDTSFIDSESISPWAKKAVDTMKSYGIVNGMGNNSYMPKETVNRASMASIFTSLVKATVDASIDGAR